MKEAKATRPCELCNNEASLHCDADSAFLCWACDARVHEANFLVARHVRQTLCCKCKCLTGSFVSGCARSQSPSNPICQSCFQACPFAFHATTLTKSSSSSDCISSTESSAAKVGSNQKTKQNRKISSPSSSASDVSGEVSNIPARISGEFIRRNQKRGNTNTCKAVDIFVIWCKRLGFNCNITVSRACQALELCMETLKVLPFRIHLAASFWLGLRACSGGTSVATLQNLRKVEEVSGVPAKLIVAVETRLTRAMKARRRTGQERDLEEGWAECNA